MTKYYTYNATTKSLVPAPNAVRTAHGIVCNPNKPEHFVLVNAERAEKNLPPYLPNVIDEPPQTDSAHYAVPTGYEQDGDAWRRLYEVLEVQPPPPRRFATADVIEQLMVAGVYPHVRAWMDNKGMTDMVLATKEFTSDDRNYIAARTALQSELGWTDSQVEKLLAKAEIRI